MTRIKTILLLILVWGIVILSGCKIRECRTDLECFKESAMTCSRVRINLLREGNNIRVTVRGLTPGSCLVSFKIEKISQTIKNKYPFETKIAKDKTLNCKINKKYANYGELNYIEEIFNLPNEFEKSCSGPIKDLMKGPLKEIIIDEFNKVMQQN